MITEERKKEIAWLVQTYGPENKWSGLSGQMATALQDLLDELQKVDGPLMIASMGMGDADFVRVPIMMPVGMWDRLRHRAHAASMAPEQMGSLLVYEALSR